MATTAKRRSQAGGSKTRLERRATGKRTSPLQPFRSGHGGARPGAGRKPKIPGKPGVDHRQRAPLAKQFPVHVTIELRTGLPSLRSKPAYEVVRSAFAAGCSRNLSGRFRLCHYAVLNDLLHLICEAESRTALARGMQGLMIRIARALNKLWSRRGRVFADRYHDQILKSPREVRNALRLVFGAGSSAGGKKHAAEGRENSVLPAIDTFTSAPWFDGFRERIKKEGIDAIVPPVTDARTWMLTEGWLQHGRLSVHEVPVTARRRRP